MNGLLAGIRVIELGRFVAAPWCGQILADLGADVIKIERPRTGDQMRQYGPPFLKDRAGADTAESSYFIACNRGKRSVTVDFTDPRGQTVIRDLSRHAAVLIENFKAGDLLRFGLDAERLRAANPSLVYLSISGFGQTGPYAGRPGLDSVFQAMGGLMSVTGEPGGAPTKVGVTIVDMITGLYGAIGVLAGLRGHEVLGRGGQHVDLALLDAAIASMTHRAQDYLLTGEVPQALGTQTTGSAPAQVFRCRDGWINLQAGDDAAWRVLCEVLDRRDLPAESAFRTRALRWQNRNALLPQLEREIAARGQLELCEALIARDVVCSPVYTLDQTFADPQVIHRGVRQSVQHPTAGEVPIVASPLRFSNTPIEVYGPPPTLGQHTVEVLSQLLGYDSSRIDELRASGVV